MNEWMNEMTEEGTPLPPPVMSKNDWMNEDIPSQGSMLDANLQSAILNKETPERAAKVLELQKKTGLPINLVDSQFELVEQEAAKRDFNAETFSKENPIVAKWMSENPQQAVLGKDDLENLSLHEWMFKAPARAFEQGREQIELQDIRFKHLFSGDKPVEDEARIREIKEKRKIAGEYGAETWFGRALTGGAEFAPQLGEQYGTGAKYAASALGAAALGAVVFPPAAPALAVAGATTAGGLFTLGVMQEGFKMEAAGAYDEFIDMNMDDDVARYAAIAAGALNMGLEAAQTRILLKAIPGSEKFLGKFARDAVKESLKNPTVVKAIKNIAFSYGKTLTLESAVEAAQRVITVMAGEAGKVISGGKDITGKEFEYKGLWDYAREAGHEFIGATEAFGYLPLPGVVVQGYVARNEIAQAKQQEQFFKALGDTSKNSKLRENLPEKYQEIIGNLTKDGPVETVYTPIEFFQSHFQTAGVDPRQVAVELGIEKTYDEAVQSGSKLAIPTSVYATKIAPTDNNAAFIKELALTPDGLTSREADDLKAEFEKAKQAEPDVMEQSLERIRTDVKTQLERFMPAEVSGPIIETMVQKYQSRSDRMGIDPFTLYQQRKKTFTQQGLEKPGIVEEVKAGATTPEAMAVSGMLADLGIDIKTTDAETLKQLVEGRPDIMRAAIDRTSVTVQHAPREAQEEISPGADMSLPSRSENEWAKDLPDLPSRVHAELAKVSSAEFGTAQKKQLQELRSRISEKGETPEAAVRAVWGQKLGNAPRGLRQAFARGLALSDVPFEAPQQRIRFSGYDMAGREVSPVEPSLSPQEKADKLHELGRENEPGVNKALEAVDASIPAAVSSSDFKAKEKIIAKGKRIAIRKISPWWDVEYVRDSFRFKTVLPHLGDSIKALQTFLTAIQKEFGKPAQVLKLDLNKLDGNNPFGWRMVPVDLRMPNGQIVEYYFLTPELQLAQNTRGHDLFEKWRERNFDSLTPEERDEYNKDAAESKTLYDAAWEASAKRSGLNPSEFAASIRSAFSSSPLASLQPETSTTLRPAGALSLQTPSGVRNARVALDMIRTSPSGETVTWAMGSPPGQIIAEGKSSVQPMEFDDSPGARWIDQWRRVNAPNPFLDVGKIGVEDERSMGYLFTGSKEPGIKALMYSSYKDSVGSLYDEERLAIIRLLKNLREAGLPDSALLTVRGFVQHKKTLDNYNAAHWGLPLSEGNKSVIGMTHEILTEQQGAVFAATQMLGHEIAHSLDIREGVPNGFSTKSTLFEFEIIPDATKPHGFDPAGLSPILREAVLEYTTDRHGFSMLLDYPIGYLEKYANHPVVTEEQREKKQYLKNLIKQELFAQIGGLYYTVGATAQGRALLMRAFPQSMKFFDEVHNGIYRVHTIAERDLAVQRAFRLIATTGSEMDQSGLAAQAAATGAAGEQARGGVEGRDTGRIEPVGFGQVFTSPNIEDILTLDEAQQALNTPEQEAFRQAALEYAREKDPQATTTNVLGAWIDPKTGLVGENSTATLLPNVTSMDDLRDVGATQGLDGAQKSTALFLYDENGPDVLHEFFAPGDLRAIDTLLRENGIENMSYGLGDGGFIVEIIDPKGGLIDNVKNVTQTLKTDWTYHRGQAEFLGADTREEAREVFRRTLERSGRKERLPAWGAHTTSKAAQQAVEFYQTGQPSGVETGPMWYSALIKGVQEFDLNSAPAARWINVIKKLQNVKSDEIIATRIEQFLKEKTGPITKQQILDFLKETEITYDETLLVEGGQSAEPYFNFGSWETVEPDTDWLSERANELVNNQDWEENSRAKLADRQGIEPEEVSEDDLHEKAYDEEYNNYYDDSESPREKAINVDVGNDTYSFTMLMEYGTMRIHSKNGKEVYEGRKLNESRIVEEITIWLAENVNIDLSGEGGTKFDSYVVPDGKNYKELFVTAPDIMATEGLGVYHGSVQIQSGLPKAELQKWLDDEIQRLKEHIGVYEPISKNDPSEQVRKNYAKRTEESKKRLDYLQKATVKQGATARPVHWEDGHGDYSYIDNHIVRLRFNERVIEGKKTLFIEEIQPPSSTGDNNFAKMPEFFQNNWVLIGIKRVLRYAAENNIDHIAMTPGWVQAERYSLSKQVDEIHVSETSEGEYVLQAMQHGDERLSRDIKNKKGLTNLIGPKLADKAMSELEADKAASHFAFYLTIDGMKVTSAYKDKASAQFQVDDYISRDPSLKSKLVILEEEIQPSWYTPKAILKGLDLKVGGEELKILYDEIITNSIAKYINKWGGKVKMVPVPEMGQRQKYEGPEYTVEEIFGILNKERAKVLKGEFENQDWSLRLLDTLENVALAMRQAGKNFTEAMQSVGVPLLAKKLGGKFVKIIETAPSFEVTPRMKASVMQGQAMFQKERGVTRIMPDRSLQIELFKDANLSTFLHESGHVFLLEMYDDVQYLRGLKTLTPKQQGIVSDFNALLKWLNISEQDLITMSAESIRANEQFAKGWEVYLSEGRAPSIELRSAFQRFKAWLVQVYRLWRKDATISKELNVHLNDEVRAIMDRLLATDDQIKAAQEDAEIKPIFTDAVSAGMSDVQFEAYRKTLEKENERAKENLEQQLIKEYMRERKEQWKDEREKVRAEVDNEIGAIPIYGALESLQSTEPGNIKLNRKAVIERYGKDRAKVLPTGMLDENGIDPDTAAEMLGFKSGEALISQLAAMQPRNKLVESETDRRMYETHGNMLMDGSFVDKAKEAVRDEGRSEIIAEELKALQKKLREVKPFVEAAKKEEQQKQVAGRQIYLAVVPTVKEARALAEQSVATSKVREIRPMQFFFAARKASKAAIEAMRKGDVLVAAVNKRQELIATEMYRAAVQAQKEIDKIIKNQRSFDKTSKRERIGKAGEDFLNQIDTLRARYNLHPQSEAALTKKKAALREWYNEQVDLGFTPGIDPDLLDESKRLDYREATLDELRALNDAVNSIAFIAGRQGQIAAMQKQVAMEETIEAMKQRAGISLKKLSREKERILKNWLDRFHDKAVGFDVALAPMETIMEILDDGAIGPFHDYIFNIASEAQSAEYDMQKKLGEEIGKIVDDFNTDKEYMREKFENSLFPEPISRHKIISLALNIGNESSFDKLIRGYGWQGREQEVMRLIGQLNAKDLKFIQQTWGKLNTLYPALNELNKRVSGITLPQLEARAFTVTSKDGETITMKGGYYPAVYDPRLSTQGAKQDTGPVAGLTEKGYSSAVAPDSFRKGRTKYAGPMLLDFEFILNRHFMGVVKDLTHREFMIDMNRLFRNQKFRNIIHEHLGAKYEQMFMPWLKGVVNDRNTGENYDDFDSMWEILRSRVTVVALGYKITSQLAQFAGYSNSLEYISDHYGASYMTSALLKFQTHPLELFKFIRENSGEMRNRFDTMDREMRDELRKIRAGKVGMIRAAIERGGFYGINLMDRMVSIPTWHAAYQGALDQMTRDTPGMDTKEMQKKAIHAADAAVRRTQGAAGAKDLNALQRKRGFNKIMTLFYTPFAAWYGRLRHIKSNIKQKGWKYTPEAIIHVALITMVSTVLAEILAGRGPTRKCEPDDLECMAKWLASKSVSALTAPVPFLRDIGNAIELYIEKGQMRDTRYSPVMDSISKITKTGIRTGEALFGDREFDDELAFDLFETSGYFLALPTAQPRITLEYIHDLMTDETSPETPLEFLHGLAYRRVR